MSLAVLRPKDSRKTIIDETCKYFKIENWFTSHQTLESTVAIPSEEPFANYYKKKKKAVDTRSMEVSFQTANNVHRVHSTFMNQLERAVKIKIDLIDSFLPIQLSSIALAINNSTYLLDLQDDWDDQGSTAIDFNTWRTSVEYLINYSTWIYEKFDIIINHPKINAGPKDSIDMLWHSSKFRLLMNIQKNGDDVTYYGDNNHNKNSVKGRLDSDGIQTFFAMWLMEMNS